MDRKNIKKVYPNNCPWRMWKTLYHWLISWSIQQSSFLKTWFFCSLASLVSPVFASLHFKQCSGFKQRNRLPKNIYFLLLSSWFGARKLENLFKEKAGSMCFAIYTGWVISLQITVAGLYEYLLWTMTLWSLRVVCKAFYF